MLASKVTLATQVTRGDADGARPTIYIRADWGADESIRAQSNPAYGEDRETFVHHTAGGNTYDRSDVPAIIRGIYAYHVSGRGWRDIGYNFLIDKFGQIWEGRFGGMTTVRRPCVDPRRSVSYPSQRTLPAIAGGHRDGVATECPAFAHAHDHPAT